MITPIVVQQSQKLNSNHLSFLDGFRGFAALWVLVSHSMILSGWSFPILKRGDIAVELFMVMSGFLMAFHYYERKVAEPWSSSKTWLKFYIRRFFRIAPLYYVLLFVALWMGPALYVDRCAIDDLYSSPRQLNLRYEDNSLENVLMHMTFLFGLFPKFSFSTPLPDWSIGLEMQFYLVFPFLVLFLRKNNYFWPVIVISGLGFVLTNFFLKNIYPMPSFLPLKVNYFLIGMILAAANYYKLIDRNKCICLVSLSVLIAALCKNKELFTLVVLLVLILFYERKKDFFRIKSLVEFFEKFLANPISRLMAELSYGVYLVHLLIMIPWGGYYYEFQSMLIALENLDF